MVSDLAIVDQSPHSNDIEQAVIGAVLSNPNSYAMVAAFLKPSHFYIMRHQYIWEAFARCHSKAYEFDYLTVTDELIAMGKLPEVGGAFYLLSCINAAPTAMHSETYGKIVLSAWLRREMLIAADVIKAVALGVDDFDIEDARAEMARQTARVMGVELNKQDKSLMEIAIERQNFIEQRMANPELILGVPTGLRAYDTMTAGLQKTDLIILAGVPGMGKTSMMLTMALNAAKVYKQRIGFFSQEMGEGQIWDRLLSMETGINLQRIRTGDLDQQEYRRYLEASSRLVKLPIFIHAATVSPPKMRSKALQWASHDGLDLIMLDYLQIMSSDGVFKPTQRAQEVGWFARSCKALAKELNVPVLSAAQLNREVNGVPELRHLRDSGEIEQEADVVTFIYRDDYYNPASEFPNQADLIIAKQRNGPTGVVSCYWDRQITRFVDSTPHHIDLNRSDYIQEVNE